jgi:hypothetical protein
MAPERFSWDGKINGSSKEDDVYSLTMTSFEVRFSAVNSLNIRSNHTVTIRSLRGYCHTATVIDTGWPPILDAVNDRPAHGTQAGIDGCKTPSGIQSRPAGAINLNSDASSLLCIRCFWSMVRT